MQLEIMVEQQVKRLVDAAGRRVLDGDSAVGGTTFVHGRKDVFKSAARQRLHILAKMAAAGFFGEGAVFALECHDWCCRCTGWQVCSHCPFALHTCSCSSIQ